VPSFSTDYSIPASEIAMKSMKIALGALWREEEGLTMVEYCIAGGLVAAGAAVAFTNLGAAINTTITNLITYMNLAPNAA